PKVGRLGRGAHWGGQAGAVGLGRALHRSGAPPPRPHQVQRTGPRDRRQPSGDATTTGVVARRVAPHLSEGVGDDLLRISTLPRDGEGEAIGHLPVAIVQGAQGALVTPRHALDQRAVGRTDLSLLIVQHRRRTWRPFRSSATRVAQEGYAGRRETDWLPPLLRPTSAGETFDSTGSAAGRWR